MNKEFKERAHAEQALNKELGLYIREDYSKSRQDEIKKLQESIEEMNQGIEKKIQRIKEIEEKQVRNMELSGALDRFLNLEQTSSKAV